MNERSRKLIDIAHKFATDTIEYEQNFDDIMHGKLIELVVNDVLDRMCAGVYSHQMMAERYGYEYKPTMTKLPKYGDLMTAEEWLANVECGAFISDDGSGYWATEAEHGPFSCWDEQPEWATHVIWFNK